MSDLVKTTVYLRRSDYERLQMIARRQKRPAAEAIRDAVREYSRTAPIEKTPTSIGAGRSRRGDVAERAEELLDGFGNEA